MAGPVARGRPLRPRPAARRRPAQRRRPLPLLAASTRSSPTSTPAGTTSTSRSRTGATTSTSARSIRTANAFNAAAFHIVGRRRWNRRGAMVTDRYQHEHHHPDAGRPRRRGRHRGADGRGIPLIGIDNLPGSVPLETHDLPRECVLVFGQEGPGSRRSMRAACDGRAAHRAVRLDPLDQRRGRRGHRHARLGAPARLRQHPAELPASVDLSEFRRVVDSGASTVTGEVALATDPRKEIDHDRVRRPDRRGRRPLVDHDGRREAHGGLRRVRPLRAGARRARAQGHGRRRAARHRARASASRAAGVRSPRGRSPRSPSRSAASTR